MFKFCQAHDIEHLVLPTRDYLFAPSLSDISQAVDFIHGKYFVHRIAIFVRFIVQKK